jgi:D-3-phosphoglycerate dehydrogenase / 2-oxoglutarate reductase
MKVLVTCPPMLGMLDHLKEHFQNAGLEYFGAPVVQTLTEDELCAMVPKYDGWIIGDDPATRRVFAAGRAGILKAAVKWGIGTDNIDFAACKEFGIPIINTPNMFGAEVADMALGYVIALARETFTIDREVRAGNWIKPAGISLLNKTLALVGFGDIGQESARRFLACGLNVNAYDPAYVETESFKPVQLLEWPERVGEADFLVITCSLNESTKRLINASTLKLCKQGLRLVNVARGQIVDEVALENALDSGQVYSAALDVFEVEPLPQNSNLRNHPRCILGSHNASNTVDAVQKASLQAIARMKGFLRG